jgi:hypothetical protein
MPIPIQGPCQLRKTAKNRPRQSALARFANQALVGFTNCPPGTFAGLGASIRNTIREE